MSKYLKKYLKYKSKYTNLKNRSKAMELNKYLRCSLIILESFYENAKQRSEPAIILFRNSKWERYTDIGGKMEEVDIINKNLDDSLKNAAIRESIEESENTINLSPRDLDLFINFYDEKSKKYHRIYAVCVQGGIYDKTRYFENRKIINQRTKEYIWRETNDVTRFYVSDLKKKFESHDLKHDFACLDADGKSCILYNRTVKYISLLLKNNFTDRLLKNPIKLSCSLYDKENDLLKGTHVFTSKVKVEPQGIRSS